MEFDKSRPAPISASSAVTPLCSFLSFVVNRPTLAFHLQLL